VQSSVGHAPADSLKREHCLKILSPQPGIGPGGEGEGRGILASKEEAVRLQAAHRSMERARARTW